MRICKIENCKNKIVAFEYCNKHYKRFKKHGNPYMQTIGNNTCSINGCKRKYQAKGYCWLHYNRMYTRGGDPSINLKKFYSYNKNYFNTLNEKSCYLLGWITTDGYIDEKHGAIKISITDKEILEKLRDLVCKDIQISTSQSNLPNRKRMYHLKFSSREMVNDCVSLGIKQRKSLTIDMPKIPDEYFYHFLRGAIDGDGCLQLRNRKYKDFAVSYCSGSLKLISKIKGKTGHTGKIKIDNSYKNPNYSITWYSKKALDLCELIYSNSNGLYLDRKYQKYLEYKTYLGNKEDK